MQWNRSHPSHRLVHGFLRALQPSQVWTRPLVLMAAILLLTVSATQAPDPIQRSCKPQPPYGIEITASGGSQWTLALRNSASGQDVVVWMWSETTDPTGKRQDQLQSLTRRQVWAGTLAADEFRRLSIDYTPAADASRVWASVEAANRPQAGPDAPIMRGLAVAPWTVPETRGRQKLAELTEDPVSSRRVMQYVGQGGVQ